MVTTVKRSITISLALVMMFALSVSVSFAQEEAVEASTGSDGLMIAVIGVGVLIIFGLGAAMNAQESDE